MNQASENATTEAYNSPDPVNPAAVANAPQNPIMKFFRYTHLPEQLQKISKPFAEMAYQIDDTIPNGAEKSAGLRKLLEAKDCIVRAALCLIVIFTMSACSSAPKEKTYSQQEAEAIYKKGIEDAKPKPLVLLQSSPGIDKAPGEFFFTTYQDSSGGGFSLPVSCQIKYLGKFNTKTQSYQLYKGIAKAFCPGVSFYDIEKQANAEPIAKPKPKATKLVNSGTANSSAEK